MRLFHTFHESGAVGLLGDRYLHRVGRQDILDEFWPFLENVPHFNGIMFHAGNYPKDTEGCILVGEHPTAKNGVVLPLLNNSRRLFAELKNLIYEADRNGEEVNVTIRDIREIY